MKRFLLVFSLVPVVCNGMQQPTGAAGNVGNKPTVTTAQLEELKQALTEYKEGLGRGRWGYWGGLAASAITIVNGRNFLPGTVCMAMPQLAEPLCVEPFKFAFWISVGAGVYCLHKLSNTDAKIKKLAGLEQIIVDARKQQ